MNIATEIVDTSIGSIWLARRADAARSALAIRSPMRLPNC
jgi:hypothetical protein